MALQFKTSLDQSGFMRGLAAMDKGAGDFANKFSAVLSGGAAGAAVLALGTSVYSVGKMFVDAGSDIADTAANLGLTTDEVQRLGFAFLQAGTDAAKFEVGIKSLEKKLDDALNGSGEEQSKAIAAYEKIGVTWERLQKMRVAEALNAVADAAKDAQSPAEAMGIAMEFMGKSGAKMAGALKGGAEGIKEVGDAAKIIGADDVSQWDALGDTMQKKFLEVRNTASATALTLYEWAAAAKAAKDAIFSGDVAGFNKALMDADSKLQTRLAQMAGIKIPEIAKASQDKEDPRYIADQAALDKEMLEIHKKTVKEEEEFKRKEIKETDDFARRLAEQEFDRTKQEWADRNEGMEKFRDAMNNVAAEMEAAAKQEKADRLEILSIKMQEAQVAAVEAQARMNQWDADAANWVGAGADARREANRAEAQRERDAARVERAVRRDADPSKRANDSIINRRMMDERNKIKEAVELGAKTIADLANAITQQLTPLIVAP